MGNISASILFLSPKTACYKVLGWCSQKLKWKDFEFPDHVRRVVKTTVTIDMEKAKFHHFLMQEMAKNCNKSCKTHKKPGRIKRLRLK